MSGPEDFERSRRNFKIPNSARHPIPTVQQYRDSKQKQKAALSSQDVRNEDQKPSQLQSALQAGRDYWYGNDSATAQTDDCHDHSMRGERFHSQRDDPSKQALQTGPSQRHLDQSQYFRDDTHIKDTTEQIIMDQKQKRKHMKRRDPLTAEREVTDPVTHLPVVIHDFTPKDVARFVPDDDDEDGVPKENTHGRNPLSNATVKTLWDQGRAESSLKESRSYQQAGLDSISMRFPPPAFEDARIQLGLVHQKNAMTICIILGIGALMLFTAALAIPTNMTLSDRTLAATSSSLIPTTLILLCIGFAVWVAQTWSQNQVQGIWEDAVWAAQHTKSKEDTSRGGRESTLWFSKIIGSIWPLVNPDLFTSVADTLEDVMQASLPRFVRMVSVDDIGQGSEPLRILGVNWLPRGAAAQSVEGDGKLRKSPTDKATKIYGARDDANETDPYADEKNNTEKDEERHPDSSCVPEGMEGEEGDFVNLEIAFAYRASQFQKKFSDRVKNAHLYLAFYLPGNIKLPVWVEVRGIVGICRARLQLTPDPPFVALCTLTFLGQPKVDMTCVPLVKRGLNIMDLPLISNFVQGSIDAALSEYVAPKSITLDLHAMLAGDDFKRDTTVRGVLIIRIYRCFDFKAGDAGIPLIRPEGSSDSYISVGWAKFGKPLWSTRVIANDMEPFWDEEAYVPVGPEELDAGESLRIQLWDSDKFSADDDQGRIELDMKGLMTNEKSNGKMWHRIDPFKALQADKDMPGRCEWSVGYFSKTRLLEAQIQQQQIDKNIHSIDDLRQRVYCEAEKKLRETAKDENSELEQQKHDDWQATETQMISDSLPSEEYPSGILSIHVHQIVGLNLQQISKTGRDIPEGENSDATDDENQLADSYCTMILNHRKIFKTRTKPKNASPFFNAATERFIRDWRHTDLTLSVRDARVHENDALIGFGEHKNRRHFSGVFGELTGGIGYGRARISLCFRSVQLQAPQKSLGWDLGTVELKSIADATGELPKDLRHLHVKARTDLSSTRMRTGRVKANDSDYKDGATTHWEPHGAESVLLSVQRRYGSCLMIEFRNNAALRKDKAPACAVLWLSRIPDDEEVEVDIPVWRADKNLIRRLEKNCLPESKCGEKIGSLRIRLSFWHGLGVGHARTLGKRNLDVQNVVEVLQAANDMGIMGPMIGEQNWKGDSIDLQSHQQDDRQEGSDDDRAEEGEDESVSDDHGIAGVAKASTSQGRREAEAKKSNEGLLEPLRIDVASTHPAAHGVYSQGWHVEHGNTVDNPRDSMASEARLSQTQSPRSSKRGSGLFSSASDYLDSKTQLHRQHRGVMQWKAPRTLAWMKHKADKAADRVSTSFEHSSREPDIETEV